MMMAQLTKIAFYGYLGLTLLFMLSALVVLLLIKTFKTVQKGAVYTQEQ